MSARSSDVGTADDEFVDGTEATADGGRMSFLEHLDELRRRILYSFYVLIACCAVTFYFWTPLYAYYVGYFGENGGKLIYTQPMAGFMFWTAMAGRL